MYGVMTAMMQFQSQLEAVDRPTPRERMGRGKISPIRTQAPGTRKVSRVQSLTLKELLTRAPGRSEEEDVEADECDLCRGSSMVDRDSVISNRYTDNSLKNCKSVSSVL